MAVREQNWWQRSIESIGADFRVDRHNPKMGCNGSDVYTQYAVTDDKNVNVQSLTEGGYYKIYNDQSIEIVAGQKSKGTGVDVVIVGKNGDVAITAEKNGAVRIRASKIVLDADENLELLAGKDINIKGGGRTLIHGNECSIKAHTGNAIPLGTSFGERCFSGSFVGTDLITATFNAGSVITSLVG
jgi:hypothetical protein